MWLGSVNQNVVPTALVLYRNISPSKVRAVGRGRAITPYVSFDGGVAALRTVFAVGPRAQFRGH